MNEEHTSSESRLSRRRSLDASVFVQFRIYSEKITTDFRLHAKGYGGRDDIILSRHVQGFGSQA